MTRAKKVLCLSCMGQQYAHHSSERCSPSKYLADCKLLSNQRPLDDGSGTQSEAGSPTRLQYSCQQQEREDEPIQPLRDSTENGDYDNSNDDGDSHDFIISQDDEEELLGFEF
eukprot:GHVU01193695.1.p1 GENE.GHVU01193695.1~~GHVU01193695.1.p1  ORF type:complete len:113 (+),score=21.00 GHVU01193695.1:52-390(+)